MIFLGSYYLINLILAVVASSYEDQRKTVENSLEEERRELLQEKVGFVFVKIFFLPIDNLALL